MEKKDWDEISEDYFGEVLSPFAKGVENPLFDAVSKIPKKCREKALDLGCGLGLFEGFLAKQFRKVVAIDYSEEMIKKCPVISGVDYFVADMRDLSRFGKFDCVIAVNSILGPSLSDVEKIFSGICKAVKKNGWFIGVFPALETELFDAYLVYTKLAKEGLNNSEIMKKVREEIGNDYDFLTGILKTEGQKHYYRFEVERRMMDAGFRSIKVLRVYYPGKEYGIERKEKVWDWLVVCRK